MKISDLYKSLTDRVIRDIKEGLPPWSKPWKAPTLVGSILPENAISRTRYKGINIPILWGTANELGYPSHAWLTYRQANSVGAHIRKGEKGTTVVFTKWLEKENDDGEIEKRPMLRTYTVFNVAQVEGLPSEYHPQPDIEDSDKASRFFRSLDIPVTHGGDRAFYDPTSDRIQLPSKEHFVDADAYFATRAHESIHATGHKNRLDRKLCGKFGDADYAFEELVAELGGAFLCAYLGMQYDTQTASYVGNWVSVLENDNRAIFKAASFASQAADFWIEQAEHAVTDTTPDSERAA